MSSSFTRDWIGRALNCLEQFSDPPPSILEAQRWLRDAERWHQLQHGFYVPVTQRLELPAWLSPWAAAHGLELRCPALTLQADGEALESLLRHSLADSTRSGSLHVELIAEGVRFRFEACSVRLPSPYQRALGEALNARPLADGWSYAQSPPNQDEALLDLTVLDEATMHDREFEAELIEAFLSEGWQNLRFLQQNYAVATLHSFKGSAALVGATELTASLQQQERDPDPRTLPLLEQEFARVERALRRHLDRS